ncbi:MAG: septum formation protein [Halocynthiibacter sp.]|jgi:septum formation protein
MLRSAGVEFEARPAKIDEETIKASLLAEGAKPREIADALAEGKARKIAMKEPGALVLGCDQVLDLKGKLFSKPRSIEEASAQLAELSGQTHKLLSAAVLYEEGKPVWRHIGEARLTMRSLSPEYQADYLARNWESIRSSVGCYKLEEEGVRLFARVEGSNFTVLGLPLVEFLSYLTLRGDLAG